MSKKVKWVANRKFHRPDWTQFVFRKFTRDDVKEVCAWCEEQLEQRFSYHVYQYSVNGNDWGYCVFLLEKPTDAVGFKIRWV